MAKKKPARSGRPQQFKYATVPGAPIAPASSVATGRIAPAALPERDFSYVRNDMIRIVLFGGGLLVAELILWYFYGHTGLGNTVENFIKL